MFSDLIVHHFVEVYPRCPFSAAQNQKNATTYTVGEIKDPHWIPCAKTIAENTDSQIYRVETSQKRDMLGFG